MTRRNARPIRVGIVGLGFMGRTHLAAYLAAERAGHPNEVVALCDADLARLRGKRTGRGNLEARGADPLAAVRAAPAYAEPAELFADERVELVSICTPTPTHVPLALAALRAGKHVLVEKPVALRAVEVEKLARAARTARRVCMPAMCMRFWPGWDWLKRTIDAQTHGPVVSAVFRRLAAPPAWSRGFYGDARASGGALFDLHVHDADFVRYCFGAPDALASAGTLDHVTTLYRYKDGPPHVVAEGGWNHTSGFPFFMGYTVAFERATAEFALGREPLLTLAKNGKTSAIPLANTTGYDGEVRHALDVVARRAKPRATLAEAAGLVAMLELERRSARTGRVVRVRG
jgi:predicted dehydrogenase